MRTSYSVLTQTQTVQYGLLHTYAIWYSLLLLGYKPVQHVTLLNTVANCNTVVIIVILWDHRLVCGPSLTETSLCGAWLYCFESSRIVPARPLVVVGRKQGKILGCEEGEVTGTVRGLGNTLRGYESNGWWISYGMRSVR